VTAASTTTWDGGAAIGRVLAQLDGVKANGGDKWMCRCPAHDDAQGSLSVRLSDTGKILFYCHAGCTFDEVKAKIDLPRPTGSSAPTRARTVRTTRWEIKDAAGAVVAVHVRDDLDDGGKSVWWQLPDGTRNLGGKKVADLPLYGLSDVKESASPIIITEGEKAADALRANDVTACGTVTGASQCPGDEALRPLLVRPVYLWPDNDDAGHAHMNRIAAALHRLGHRDVRIIDWKGAPGKGDAADLVATEGWRDDFDVLLDEARPYDPSTAVGVPAAEAPVPIYTRCAADIAPEPVRWVWRNRLARGKLTLIASDPGMGKSLLSIAMTATVTTGGNWPAGEGRCEDPGEVLMASYEDDLADTVVPRLMAAGADRTRVHFLEKVPGDDGARAFDIGRDIDRLEALLQRHPQVRLLVIDPITAAMIGVDSHKNAEVRSVLHPLADVAARHGVAVLGITHVPKGAGGKAIHKVIGSIAFVAQARIAFITTKDNDDPTGDRHLFLPTKSNIGDDRVGLSYSKRGIVLPNGIEAWCIEWGEHVNTSADEALGPDDGERGALEGAKEFLRDTLKDGIVAVEQIEERARKAKIAWRTLERAKGKLKGKARKMGLSGWGWELPGGPQ
jgi:putative DNA primase/helicase